VSKKQKLYKMVLRQYEQIQTKNQHQLQKNRNEVEEIENEIALVGVRIARMVLQKPKDTQLLLKKLKKAVSKLKEEKKQLLNELGFSEKALEINYICNDCKDTGYIDNVPCHCMKQKLIDLNLFNEEKGVFIVNHFSHNGKWMHHEFEAFFNPHHILVAYDGMEINY